MRALVFLLFLSLPSTVFAECRHALILAMDVSASVTWKEYRMQQRGLAFALRDAEVVDLILAEPERPISILIFEWAGNFGHDLVSNWSRLETVQDIEALANRIETFNGSRRSFRTATGTALIHALEHFDRGPNCDRRTIDVSSDGRNNMGPDPIDLYSSPRFFDIVINTLSIGEELTVENAIEKNAALLDYFETEVNHGPGSFTIPAIGFTDFADAMKKKLIRELSPIALSQKSPLKYAQKAE